MYGVVKDHTQADEPGGERDCSANMRRIIY